MKAVVLISGGLDSILAARFMKELGVEIVPLNFKIPFCHLQERSGERVAAMVSRSLHQELRTLDISDEFLKLVTQPKHGFGSNINPCIDCKILMLRRAKEAMSGWGASFLVTGEVLGQRPMSQNKQALYLIEKESGLQGLILRPLSAKLLTITAPEKQGWVDRDKLLDFSGRTRRPQMELAERFGIKDYPNAAGGCLLTDPGFSKRMRELIDRGELSLDNIELLKIGRHFRVSDGARLVVGRNESENNRLEQLAKAGDYLLMPKDIAGPVGLGRGLFEDGLTELSSRIICRYSDREDRPRALIAYHRLPDQEEKALEVFPLEEGLLESLRI